MTPEMLATLTEQVAELVQTYSNNYLQFQRATYNETQVRVDFVNRLFKLLGWDVDNERGLPQHLREVTHEATVVVEEDGVHRSKKPDYSFKVGTEVLYFLETKKPAVNLTIDAAPAFQLRRYGWSGNLKVSVLTNFTDLYIYDCSVRPREGDDIGIAKINFFYGPNGSGKSTISNFLQDPTDLLYRESNRKVLVLDDPICSLDSTVLYIVSSLVKGLIKDVREGNSDVEQIFILTHNVFFHKETAFIDRICIYLLKSQNVFSSLLVRIYHCVLLLPTLPRYP